LTTLRQWANSQTDNFGLYTSVWQWDKPSLQDGTKLGSLYFDLDSPDATASIQDAVRLVEHLRNYVPSDALRIYFTGSKGFHIECEAVALGIGPSAKLSETFRFIATDLRDTLGLTTIDFAVYDERRMWRLPYSKHQSTDLYKCELSEDQLYGSLDDIKRYAREPDHLEVPEQVFDYKANEWYREYIYKLEGSKKAYTTEDLIERFNKHGSKVLRNVNDEPKEFDPKQLFDNCPAILKWWEYAEKNKDLPHEARLFLLSILSYSEEALFYLHEILKECSDYNWEKSNAHIQDWIKRREMGIGGRPYTCNRANSVGVGCGDCNLEPRKKWIEVNGKYLETEEELSPSPIRYAYVRENKGTI
jgi:hypothetical protein